MSMRWWCAADVTACYKVQHMVEQGCIPIISLLSVTSVTHPLPMALARLFHGTTTSMTQHIAGVLVPHTTNHHCPLGASCSSTQRPDLTVDAVHVVMQCAGYVAGACAPEL